MNLQKTQGIKSSDIDFENFKGIHYTDNMEKYQDPITGCHFEYHDIYRRLKTLKVKRKYLDKRLGVKTSSME